MRQCSLRTTASQSLTAEHYLPHLQVRHRRRAKQSSLGVTSNLSCTMAVLFTRATKATVKSTEKKYQQNLQMALNIPQQQMLMMTVSTQVLRLQAQMALNLRISGRSLTTTVRQVAKGRLKLRKAITLRLPSLYSLALSRSPSKVAL